MNKITRSWYDPLLAGILIVFLALAGCDGDDGAPGKDVDPATVDDLQSQIDALKLGNVEFGGRQVTCLRAQCRSRAGRLPRGHTARYCPDGVIHILSDGYAPACKENIVHELR